MAVTIRKSAQNRALASGFVLDVSDELRFTTVITNRRSAPAEPADDAQDAVYETMAKMWLGCPTCEGVVFDRYGWHQFAGFDRAARDVLLPIGASVLDVTLLSVLRPDAHTAFRHRGGKMPPDCLHWSLPGVPDVWNLMLIGALMRCDVRSYHIKADAL